MTINDSIQVIHHLYNLVEYFIPKNPWELRRSKQMRDVESAVILRYLIHRVQSDPWNDFLGAPSGKSDGDAAHDSLNPESTARLTNWSIILVKILRSQDLNFPFPTCSHFFQWVGPGWTWLDCGLRIAPCQTMPWALQCRWTAPRRVPASWAESTGQVWDQGLDFNGIYRENFTEKYWEILEIHLLILLNIHEHLIVP